MLIVDQNILVDDVKVGLDVLEVGFADAFEENYGYFLAGVDVVRTDDFDYLGSDGFVPIMDQFFNKVEVDEDHLFL